MSHGCAKWVDYLRANGFAPSVHDEKDLDAVKDMLGLISGVYLSSGLRLLALPCPACRPVHQAGDKVGGFEVLAFHSDGATGTLAR